jgi:hypothetical protein
MPVDLSDLKTRRVRDLVVDLDGAGAVALRYRPDAYTDELETAFARLGDQGRLTGAFVALFAPMLVGWDLTDGGEPLPCDPAGIAKLGAPLCKALYLAIVRDVFADPKASSGSSNGASTTPS